MKASTNITFNGICIVWGQFNLAKGEVIFWQASLKEKLFGGLGLTEKDKIFKQVGLEQKNTGVVLEEININIQDKLMLP